MVGRLSVLAICIVLLAPASVLAQSKARELNDTGWKLLDTGDADRAAKVFAEALTHRA